ncbi:MAG: J domain-containing protein [Firmicutes bacterium]|nr:J domain-containing protein [Bacillota bacterium]
MPETDGDRNPYEVLGLVPGAGEAEIKRAYLRLVRRFPPEQHPDDFKRIRAAYEQLKDEKARARTDMGLLHLDTGRLARVLTEPRWPRESLADRDPLDLLGCCADLGRTDFRDDFTFFPWEEPGDNRA